MENRDNKKKIAERLIARTVDVAIMALIIVDIIYMTRLHESEAYAWPVIETLLILCLGLDLVCEFILLIISLEIHATSNVQQKRQKKTHKKGAMIFVLFFTITSGIFSVVLYNGLKDYKGDHPKVDKEILLLIGKITTSFTLMRIGAVVIWAVRSKFQDPDENRDAGEIAHPIVENEQVDDSNSRNSRMSNLSVPAEASGSAGHAGASGSKGHAGASSSKGHAGASSSKGHAGTSSSKRHAGASSSKGHAGASSSKGHSGASSSKGYAGASRSKDHSGASPSADHGENSTSTLPSGALSLTKSERVSPSTGSAANSSSTGYARSSRSSGSPGASFSTGSVEGSSSTGSEGASALTQSAGDSDLSEVKAYSVCTLPSGTCIRVGPEATNIYIPGKPSDDETQSSDYAQASSSDPTESCSSAQSGVPDKPREAEIPQARKSTSTRPDQKVRFSDEIENKAFERTE